MLRELEAQEAFGVISLTRHDVDVARVILGWEDVVDMKDRVRDFTTLCRGASAMERRTFGK
jgi:hypothetical protein